MILQGYCQLQPGNRLGKRWESISALGLGSTNDCGKPCTSWAGLNGRSSRPGESWINPTLRQTGWKRRCVAGNTNVIFGILEREFPSTLKSSSRQFEKLMGYIQTKTWKGSAYNLDAFLGYPFLKRFGKHHTINPSKMFVSRRRDKNQMNEIEGVGSYAKCILYHYWDVSK